jgi:hypothetical protein
MMRSRTVAPHDPRPDSEVWLNDDGSVLAYGYSVGAEHCIEFPEVATFTIHRGLVEVNVAPGISRTFVEEAFRRIVLPYAIHLSGGEALHASAVIAEAGVVVLCGGSERGKSTLAFGLTRRGYAAWADDAVAVDARNGRAYSAALPFRLRLRPEPRRALGAEDDLPEDVGAHGTTRPLAALFVLEQDAAAAVPAASRLSGADAYIAVLRHAYYFSAADRPRMDQLLERYLELASTVPTFALHFPTGLQHLEPTLDVIETSLYQLTA